MHISETTFSAKSPLVQRVRGLMRSLRMSPSTEAAYVSWIVRFVEWIGDESPASIQRTEDYLAHLVTLNTPTSSLRQAEAAISLLVHKSARGHRTRSNLLTAPEIDRVLDTMPNKYRVILSSINNFKSLRELAALQGVHFNSVGLMLRVKSRKHTGKTVSVQGFKRSVLLREIAGGLSWADAEKKYGRSVVKTACAEFVRMLSPKILVDNLAC